VLTATVLEEYRCGRLSHGQVGKLLGINRFEVDAFLKENNVPLNYSIKDLEDDRRTLDEHSFNLDDGDDHRTRPAASAAILKRLGLIAEDALPDLSPMPIKNRRGGIVRRVESGTQ